MNRVLIVLMAFLGPLVIFLVFIGTWHGVYYLCHNMIGWDIPSARSATIMIITCMFVGAVLSPIMCEDKG